MKFSAIIPTNSLSVMTNGSIRLKIDIDKQYASIIPELMEMADRQLGIFLVDETEAGNILDKAKKKGEKKKSPETKLVQKMHVLMKKIADNSSYTLEGYKSWYKKNHNITVSTSVLDRDSLLGIIGHLASICSGMGLDDEE